MNNEIKKLIDELETHTAEECKSCFCNGANFVAIEDVITLVEKLTELRKPSENLVEEIKFLLEDNIHTTEFVGSDGESCRCIKIDDFDNLPKEIANLAPFNQNAELLDILKEFVKDFQVINGKADGTIVNAPCRDFIDNYRRAKKAIQNTQSK